MKSNSPRGSELARQSYDVFAAGEGPDHPYTAHALLEIGRNYLEQDRVAEAEPVLRRCLEIRRKKLESPHPDLARAQVSLGRCLIRQNRHQEAAVLLREAETMFVTLYGPDNELTQTTRTVLAEAEGHLEKQE